MKSPKLVLVEWIDACHAPAGWLFGEPPKVDFKPVYSTGFLLEKRKHGILLAQTWFDGDHMGYGEDNPKNHCSGFAVLTIKDGELLYPEFCYVRNGVAYFRGAEV